MEIKHFRYILIVPPAASSISALITSEYGVDPTPIRRKEMKEIVLRSILEGHTPMVEDEGLGIKRLIMLNDQDMEQLKHRFERP